MYDQCYHISNKLIKSSNQVIIMCFENCYTNILKCSIYALNRVAKCFATRNKIFPENKIITHTRLFGWLLPGLNSGLARYWSTLGISQQTRHIDPLLGQRRRRWHNIGSTLVQHWVDVSCLLGIYSWVYNVQ